MVNNKKNKTMSYKRENHKVRLQKEQKIEVDIPVLPVDTSISNLAKQRTQSQEPSYSGDNPDVGYMSVTERRALLNEVTQENDQNSGKVKKYQDANKRYNEFKDQLKTDVELPKE